MDITVRSKWILHNKASFTTFLLPLCPHKLRKLVKVRRTAPLPSWDLWDPTFEARLVICRTHQPKISESFIRFQTSSTQSSGAQSLSTLLIQSRWQIWPSRSASSRFIGTFFELTVASKTARYKSNSTCRWKTCGCPSLTATLLSSFANLEKHQIRQNCRVPGNLTSKHFCYFVLRLNYIV